MTRAMEAYDELLSLLRDMHRQRTLDPNAFARLYPERAREAVFLATRANLEGQATMSHGTAPSALHYAAGCGCLEACERLMTSYPKLGFCTDPAGQTPLGWAAQSGLRGTVALLLSHGVDPLHLDIEGRAPLHLAAAAGNPQTCELLLEATGGRGHELRTVRGLTPLHVAAMQGHAEVCEQLLAAGANPSTATPQARVPLHLAAASGSVEAILCLLEVKPEAADLADAQGAFPADLARERGCFQAAALLEEESEQAASGHEWWRARFEPPCRALLNAPLCEAYLEIGTPVLVSVEHQVLNLKCRVVDALNLIERYTVQVRGCGGARAAVRYARAPDQKPMDDLAFRVPRNQGSSAGWRIGMVCRFRVIGELNQAGATVAGLPSGDVSSAWTQPLRVPGQGF